jgi:hypothetical protein
MLRLVVMMAPLCIIWAFMWAGARLWLRRQRGRNPGLRGDIAAHISFETAISHASLLGTRGYRGFGGTRGRWIPLQGPRRLTVGTNAFIFSAPNALKEYAFTGRECTIAYSQAPSRFMNRNWIVITGQANGRQVQVAISDDNLPEIWQALTAAGVTYEHRPA